MITRTIDERRPENGIIQFTRSDGFFGCPFRAVVARNRAGPRPERAHVDEPPDAGVLRGGDQVFGSLRMNPSESLLANLTNDADEVDDRINPGARTGQRIRLGNIGSLKFEVQVGGTGSGKDPHRIPGEAELLHDLGAYETGGTGDEDFHESFVP